MTFCDSVLLPATSKVMTFELRSYVASSLSTWIEELVEQRENPFVVRTSTPDTLAGSAPRSRTGRYRRKPIEDRMVKEGVVSSDVEFGTLKMLVRVMDAQPTWGVTQCSSTELSDRGVSVFQKDVLVFRRKGREICFSCEKESRQGCSCGECVV